MPGNRVLKIIIVGFWITNWWIMTSYESSITQGTELIRTEWKPRITCSKLKFMPKFWDFLKTQSINIVIDTSVLYFWWRLLRVVKFATYVAYILTCVQGSKFLIVQKVYFSSRN